MVSKVIVFILENIWWFILLIIACWIAGSIIYGFEDKEVNHLHFGTDNSIHRKYKKIRIITNIVIVLLGTVIIYLAHN